MEEDKDREEAVDGLGDLADGLHIGMFGRRGVQYTCEGNPVSKYH